jgi:hypothetical protein
MTVIGEYGTIDSRAKFRATLKQTLDLAADCAKKYPDNAAIESIHAQLQAMKRATDNGRDPPPNEREGFDAGLVAIRDLDGTPDKEVGDLAEAIHPVVAFFEDWPTDAAAAAGAGTA